VQSPTAPKIGAAAAVGGNRAESFPLSDDG